MTQAFCELLNNYSVPVDEIARAAPDSISAVDSFLLLSVMRPTTTVTSFMNRLSDVVCHEQCKTKALDLNFLGLEAASHRKAVEKIVLQSHKIMSLDLRKGNAAYHTSEGVVGLETAVACSRAVRLIAIHATVTDIVFRSTKSPSGRIVSADAADAIDAVIKKNPPPAPVASAVKDIEWATAHLKKTGIPTIDCFNENLEKVEKHILQLRTDLFEEQAGDIQMAVDTLRAKPPPEVRAWAVKVLKQHGLEGMVCNRPRTDTYVERLRSDGHGHDHVPTLLRAISVMRAYVKEVLDKHDFVEKDVSDRFAMIRETVDSLVKAKKEKDAAELEEVMELALEYQAGAKDPKLGARQRSPSPDEKHTKVRRIRRF